MSLSVSPSPVKPVPLRCAIFCALVDNFGDIGVCWRLARQLVREYGAQVTLWVDDPAQTSLFLGKAGGVLPGQVIDGVRLNVWSPDWLPDAEAIATLADSDLLVEAFACALPPALLAVLGALERRPAWINLEYLSAEHWVDEHHLLASLLTLPGMPLRAAPVQKTFFFPGFTPRTGGLLRETGLLARHAQWQGHEREERQRLLARLAPDLKCALADDTVFVSLFTYESASLPGCLAAMAQDNVPTLCLVPLGRSLASVQAFLGLHAPLCAGDIQVLGALSIVVIPFLSQDDYDLLLSLCDFNFVRGEDSFVRAQWAARPLLWHIYPQQAQAHLQKLDAFLALQGAEFSPRNTREAAAGMALRQFVRFWNQGEDCQELWHHLRPQLPGLREQARKWQQHLAEMPDLTANLLRFLRMQSR